MINETNDRDNDIGVGRHDREESDGAISIQNQEESVDTINSHIQAGILRYM